MSNDNTNDNDNDNGENVDMAVNSDAVQDVLGTIPELAYKGMALTEAEMLDKIDMFMTILNGLPG